LLFLQVFGGFADLSLQVLGFGFQGQDLFFLSLLLFFEGWLVFDILEIVFEDVLTDEQMLVLAGCHFLVFLENLPRELLILVEVAIREAEHHSAGSGHVRIHQPLVLGGWQGFGC
jgi:hypothetical protein